MADKLDLKEQARLNFADALRAVDASAAVCKAVKLLGSSNLIIADKVYELTEESSQIYAIALGKAACPMALALDETIGERILGGVVSGVLPLEQRATNAFYLEPNKRLSKRRKVFAGGHPLPNEASLAAAQSCFNLLRTADDLQALVIFLVSGGSAIIEAPRDDSISLIDLQETNRTLVSCRVS